MKRRDYSSTVAAVVLGILFVPQVVEQLPLHAAGLRAPLQVGAVLLAAYVVLGYWLLGGLRLRVHLVALACFLVFALSVVPYLFVSLRDIHEAYLGCLLQYTAYPMIVAVFLPSVLPPRRIIRLCCIFLALQSLPTCLFVLLNITRGRLPMVYPVSLNPVTDANALVLGSLAFITLTVMQPRKERRGRRQRLKRAAWIASAVVLALVAASTFSRATLGGFLAALLLLLVLRWRGRRSAVKATRAVIFACAAIPLLVCTHVISSEVVERVGSLIIKKRANEEVLGSSLVRRAEVWRVFVTRISWADVVGTRPALHEYSYYHGLGVKQSIETPHNYWISMVLTAGYGGALVVFVVWDYAARLAQRSRDPVVKWVLPWLAFIAIQGITGRGAFLGLMTLAFWVFVSAAMAGTRGFTVSLTGSPVRRVRPIPAVRPAPLAGTH